MWLPSVRLEADDLDTLPLDPHSGWVPQTLDLGFPVVRDVAQNAPDADGSLDITKFVGARNVTMSIVFDQVTSGLSLWEMESTLKAFVSPRRRVRMVGQFEQGGPDVRVVMRGSQFGSLIDARDWRPATVQWVVPSGLLEAAELSSWSASAGGEASQTGLTFDATPDFSFGGITAASGGAVAENVGNVPVWPTVTMFGPFSAGTVLLNDTTDKQLTFKSSLSIATGDWLRIDFAGKTIVNSTGTSYYDSLDFASSEWWQLQPGVNRIYMLPTTFTAPPASFTGEHRHAWL